VAVQVHLGGWAGLSVTHQRTHTGSQVKGVLPGVKGLRRSQYGRRGRAHVSSSTPVLSVWSVSSTVPFVALLRLSPPLGPQPPSSSCRDRSLRDAGGTRMSLSAEGLQESPSSLQRGILRLSYRSPLPLVQVAVLRSVGLPSVPLLPFLVLSPFPPDPLSVFRPGPHTLQTVVPGCGCGAHVESAPGVGLQQLAVARAPRPWCRRVGGGVRARRRQTAGPLSSNPLHGR
jgi:hypothetical protein